MDRIRWTLLVNSLLFLAFMAVLVSGLVLWLGLAGMTGLARGTWNGMHVYSGLAFTVLVGAHLWIYRAWIMAMPKLIKR